MAHSRSSTAQFPDGAADVARRFGVTVKTLRHYETAGLLHPVRDEHGWRTYGQTECERLHLILLLRRFGLSISRIGEMLSAGDPDLALILDLQAHALEEQRARVEQALSMVRHARQHLTEHGSLDPAALAALAHVGTIRLHWTPALEALAVRSFSPAQQRHLAEVAPTIEAEWHRVFVDLAAIVDGPSDTPRARRLGARAAELIARMTGNDQELRGALSCFWQDGFADPAIARTLPLDEKGWRFLGQAMTQAQIEAGQ